MTRQEIVDAAQASIGMPEASLYARLGLVGGPARVETEVAGRRWAPRLLVSLALARRGQVRPVGSTEAQDCVKAVGLPLYDSSAEKRASAA